MGLVQTDHIDFNFTEALISITPDGVGVIMG